MHRDAKICWTGFALTSVTVAAVVTATILFTVFPKDYDASVLNFDPSQVARNAQNEKVDRFDHRAHSVPGGEYVATDFAGKGAVAVTLDGSRSHTHYVEEGPPLVTGFIQNFVWFDNATHIVLGTGVKPTIDFDVGVTEIGLTVADNTRDTQTDFTRVVIKSPIASGVYCYFYTEAPSASLVQGAKPVYAMESDKIDFATAADFPTRPWTHARCVFRALVRPGTKFTFSHAGAIQLTVKDTTVIATGSTGTYTGASTTAECQVIYTRTGGGKLQMTAGPSGLTYDLSKTLPILLKIDPTSSTFEGGGTARIDGLSLGNNLEVYFGSTKAEIDTEQVDNEGKYVYVVVPEFAAGASATVYAQSETRRSNTLGFRYSANGRAPVKFSKAVIKEGNRDFFRGQITGIKYGPDHRYHVVTHGGTVHSFEVNREMIVVPNSVCNHPALGKNRKALGLAFDYSSKAIKLYVSTSVLEWKSKGYLVSGFAWANGQIHLLQKDGASRCLKAAPRPIITGLPVSNYDHGINGLVVDDDGNLRIQVGGTTNAGYNQAGKNLGGIDESPLSGASLIAYISKSGFDGHIKYDVDNPGRANQVGGKDVQVYMAGWRNSYGINTHSNGFIYATDNGASQAFGGRSLSCTKDGPLPSTADLADRLGKVVKGKYFGHPNRNRGRRRSMECTFMNSKKASGDYLPHVLELESSTDGIVEYHMDTFDGQLKGNLMLSKYTTDKNPGALQRVRLDEQGEAVSDEEVLLRVSGLSIEMSPWGDLIMPQLWKKVVLVIRPTVSRATGQKFVGVMPARGSYRGGNQVIVTGINIGSSPGALFGDKPCTSVTAATSTSFKCIVPAGTPGGRVQVTLKSSAGDTPSSGGHDYKYMKV